MGLKELPPGRWQSGEKSRQAMADGAVLVLRAAQQVAKVTDPDKV